MRLRRARVSGDRAVVGIAGHRAGRRVLEQRSGRPGGALTYAIDNVKQLTETDVPMFGICLGHQILGLAVGGETFKLKFGHRGANHPVKELRSGKVEITSQNHGFAVKPRVAAV